MSAFGSGHFRRIHFQGQEPIFAVLFAVSLSKVQRKRLASQQAQARTFLPSSGAPNGKRPSGSVLWASWLVLIKLDDRGPGGTSVGPINTAADEVQDAVRYLERRQSGEIPAEVLRMEYCSELPREEYTKRLRLSSVRYSQHLHTAKIHVAGWLRTAFDERISAGDQQAD
jgi:hypothetical protein